MNSYPDISPEVEPEAAPVVYEQPLNERMRTFLRLEFLYTQATYHSESPSPWSARAAVSSLLEILAITARGDSRMDVLKELERQVNVLREYQSKTGVDPARLKSLMSNLVKLRNDLSSIGGNYMAPLRDSEFLSAVKHRSAIPGGTCDFDLPDYSYWLNRPVEVRAAEFDSWLTLIRPLCDSIAELLWLTRQNAKRKSEVAVGGIFQLQFDRENPCQLVRITLPADTDLFPEMSGNQHRCTIRFLNWLDAAARPAHIEVDVPFLLTCCG
ncbi:MAG TPA: cell division protein ZapD [Rhizomicrobium sp.]|jgi:cell division protein ZapD|nr:cell division protein ZapD [Rhizomicrobium sp.]